MAGSALISSLVLMTCVLLPLCAAQGHCRGRCGEPFIRGQLCNCDHSCLTHNECCKDYEEACTFRGSCRGRCGEEFQRGRECECDPDCTLYNTCCSDYHGQCAESALAARSAKQSKPTGLPKTKAQEKTEFQLLKSCKKPSDSGSEEKMRADYSGRQDDSMLPPAEYGPDAFGHGSGPSVLDSLAELMPLTADSVNPTGAPLYPQLPAHPADNTPGGSAGGPLQPGASSPSAPGKPLTIPIRVSLSITGQAGGPLGGGAGGPLGGAAGGPLGGGAGGPLGGAAGGPLGGGAGGPLGGAAGGPLGQLSGGPAAGRPSTLEDIAQALAASNPAGGLPNGPSPDLCNGSPIDALTSLFNGSVIVFQGHFFFLLDPKTRSAGPAQSITEQLGIPSPIDTAFTRCNCQGKTYIIKGDQYWVFENGVMEPGYPRSLSQDFDGLSGEITAALSVPATRKRPESIYFFKKGGTVQKYSYPAGSGPTCTGKKNKNSVYNKIRRARQAEIRLSAEININLNWKGFPTPVTSALSAPNPRKPDGFDYFIFSWPKVFNIKISGEFPTLTSPAKPPAQQSDIRNWLYCP
ncbi:proteoglycan 4-like isoform X1 [Astyanax mexicanus]|uniref:Proteoglycan 4-like isoform X1 n=1 Tax=Astyanax mexicanus TaxID=7994 RepID=A0A8T2L4B9_ASTMX|nr:proteoglycan 4-like isoform X1 [Astyanax mexicanus]